MADFRFAEERCPFCPGDRGATTPYLVTPQQAQGKTPPLPREYGCYTCARRWVVEAHEVHGPVDNPRHVARWYERCGACEGRGIVAGRNEYETEVCSVCLGRAITSKVRARKVLSGGQTGAERAGLNAAIRLGIAHGGHCPAGRRAEDGVIPSVYALQEVVACHGFLDGVHQKTRMNVAEADATLVVTLGSLEHGSELTVDICRQLGKAHLVVDLSGDRGERYLRMAEVRDWLASGGYRTLNVAGNRESRAPGIGSRAEAMLLEALAERSLA